MKMNYDIFLNEIISAKKFCYDCETLSFLADTMIMDDGDIQYEDEDKFYDVFNDLVFYFSAWACMNKEEFKRVIDDIIAINEHRKLDNIDIQFVLTKDRILTILSKYKEGFISKEILENQLKKYFGREDLGIIYDYLYSNNIIDVKMIQ